MDIPYYLNIFQQAEKQLDKKILRQKQLHSATVFHLESVVLKLYKLHWANPSADPISSPSRIFFSVWVHNKSNEERKLLYNIHALKLRQLRGYNITSRQFAIDFRKVFKKFEKNWPNVSTNFGPLTLMEGWIKLNSATIQSDIFNLASRFLAIDDLIDQLLIVYKKTAS